MTMLEHAEVRAYATGGSSNSAVLYLLVKRTVMDHHHRGGVLVDVGCGHGALHRHLAEHFERYIGVDIVRYDPYPDGPGVEFHQSNLDSGRASLPDECADVVCSLETIEHVENPRSFVRELVRLAKPNGLIVVTTPNQLSVISKLCFALKGEFVHFQERPGLYPSHLSALLEVDLLRLARENNLTDVEIAYTGEGRMPLMSRHWPRWLTAARGWRGRAFSDNVVLVGRKINERAGSRKGVM
jgi:SAM-dependent methyltransferase